MNANKAIELGFADGVVTDEKRGGAEDLAFAFSRSAVTNSLLSKLSASVPKQVKAEPKQGVPIDTLYQRLHLLQHERGTL
jgi:ATP-dependent Clp protease protease subunit